jgi:hypothetical protein
MQWTFDRVINLITAAGTVGPFIWTVTLYSREVRRRKIADALALRQQAVQVTGWVDPRERGLDGSANEATLVVRNISALPVRSLALHVIDFDGELHVENIGFVPPGETVEVHPSQFSIAILVPEETMPLAFSFADADDRRWFRDWEGGLREWPQDGNPAWYVPMVELWRPTWAPDAQSSTN